jgi:hypothetical protein
MAPVVIVAVYVVLTARSPVPVNVAIRPVESRVTAPAIAGESVNVVRLMVDGFMGSLKVAVIRELRHTPIEPFGGVTSITSGAVGGLRGL